MPRYDMSALTYLMQQCRHLRHSTMKEEKRGVLFILSIEMSCIVRRKPQAASEC